MLFLNLLSFLLINVDCSRILTNTIRSNNIRISSIPYKKFSNVAVPHSQPSLNFDNLAKCSSLTAIGFTVLALSMISHAESASSEPPIFEAVRKGDLSTFSSELINCENLNVRDGKGATLLELAIKSGIPEFFYPLIESNRVNMNTMDSQARPYLYTAIANHKFRFARKILENKQLSYKPIYLKIMIHQACLLLPSDVPLEERMEQSRLIMDLFYLSNFDRRLMFEVINSIEEDEIDPEVKQTAINDINKVISDIYKFKWIF